ncbi:MAG: phosphatidylserine/phosphatidylglycerophosphate/cardiolipin synthase family protein [Elusimicrobiota bacterium]
MGKTTVTLMAAFVVLHAAAGAVSAQVVEAKRPAPQIWAKHGSYPPRAGNDVKILIDGQAAYSEVAAAMKKAKKFVYSTFSYGDVNFLLVPETGETMFDLLRARRADGADVKIVVWEPAQKTDGTIPDPAPGKIDGVNEGPEAIQARWDKAPGYGGWYRGVHNAWWPMYLVFPPELGCNHQKTYIMDDGEGGVVAFVGGINPVQSYWDTPAHDPLDARRVEKGADPLKGLETTPPLHDIFYKIKGPAVADVLSNFVERYNGASDPHKDVTQDAVAPVTADQIAPIEGGIQAQILRTIAPKKYPGTKKGDRGIKEMYLNALNAAAKGSVVYIENQYFFDHVIINAIQDAAERGAKIIAVLTSKPDEGTPQGVLESLMEWIAKGETAGKAVHGHQNVVVMTLGNSVPDPRDPSKTISSETYIHSKNLFVFNDDWAAMAGGSANIAFTSMLFHAEMDVALIDPKTVKDAVARLWSEHLGIPYEQAMQLIKDPQAAFAYFKSRSAEDKDILDKGLAAPSRVFPFGTQFPARDLAGVDLKNRTPDAASVAAGPAGPAAVPASFDLPAMNVGDVKDSVGAPAAAPAASAPQAAAYDTTYLPHALETGVYSGRQPADENGYLFLSANLHVDTLINLGEFGAKDAGRCETYKMKCVDSPFDAAYAKPRDKENLVAAFKTALAERAAGRTVYFDSGVDDERAAAMAAALQIRAGSCGGANANKDQLRKDVAGALSEHGFRGRYRLLNGDIQDWIEHPENNAWLCEGAAPSVADAR